MSESDPSMQRRTVIAGTITGVLSLAGCIGTGVGSQDSPDSSSGTPTQTTQTPTESPNNDAVVAFEELPSEAQTEVKKAIQQGTYSECGSLAVEKAINLEADPLIKYEGQLYKPALMVGGAGKQEDDCAKHILQMDAVDGATTTNTPEDVVNFDSLSAAAQQEVKAAIQQDVYTSCEPLALADAVDSESPPWIEYQGAYYHPVFDTATASADASCDTVHTLRMRPR